MAFRKCNKCNQVKGKDLFADGFICTLCVTSNAGSPTTKTAPKPAATSPTASSPTAGASHTAPAHPMAYPQARTALAPSSPKGGATPALAATPYGTGTGGQQPSPYGTSAQASSPYGTSAQTSSPYGTAGQASSPYKTPGQASSPYGTTGQPSSPYGTSAQPSSPYGTTNRPGPAASPYGTPVAGPPVTPQPVAGGWPAPKPAVTPTPMHPPAGPPAPVRKESPKWALPKATLQNEFKTAFMILEGNFEAVASGRPIAFHEFFQQPRTFTMKRTDSTFGLALMCDSCTKTDSAFYGDTQLFNKVWLCEACAGSEEIILKQRKSAGQFLMTQTQRCFDMADVDKSGGIDFLEYVHWVYEIGTVVPCVPQKPVLVFLREVFGTYAKPGPSGKPEITFDGVKAFFEACFKAVPPQCQDVFTRHAKGKSGLLVWQFLRVLVTIFHPKCVYLQAEMNDKSVRKPTEKPTFSFRQAPKVAKSFRGAIQRYDCSLLQRKRLLGKGGLCEAWLCNYQGNDVVAKIPLPTATPEEITKMFRAARQQMKFDHENILRVLGVFEDVKPPIILLELAEGGDVSDLLIGKLDLCTQWRLAKEIAEALHCLHDHTPFPYAHRDLKGMNVFLTKDLHAKLADFDFLIEIPEGVIVSGLCGTPGYIAPEMLDGPGYDHRVDIFSYASILYEITHGINPYSKEIQGSRGPMSLSRWVPAVMEVTLQGLRPQLDPRNCPKRMRELITDCWKHNPNERPDTIQILIRLDDMAADFDAA